ncbi:MAG TPA: site-specific integrase, partial [Candidatus Mediterraneibacter ornithocaccae]|nr:site-specific integrase [Candidatus Mediterraneibacter ornithocaccae]
TYKISVILGIDTTGKQIRKSKTFIPDQTLTPAKMDKAAQKFALEFEEKILGGNLFTGEKMTLSEYCEVWLKESQKDLSPSTYNYYSNFIHNSLIPAIGYLKMADIKPNHIKSYIGNLKGSQGQELKASSIKKNLAIIKSIFKSAWNEEIIKTNPSERVKPPKQEQNTDIKCFTIEQAQVFLNILDNDLTYKYSEHSRTNKTGKDYKIQEYKQKHKIPMQFKVFFNIALFGGLRKGEILGLTWNDIDFDNSTIQITKSVCYTDNQIIIKEPKTKTSIRTITLPLSTINLIKEYRKEWLLLKMRLGSAWEGNEDFLFIQSTGKLMHPSTPYHTFKKILMQYNSTVESSSDKLPLITLHGLRHTSATLLISQNVDISTVSKRLGHAQQSTTMNIYAHSLEKMDKTAASKMENLFFTKEA